jgi:cell division cycle 14
MIPNGLVFSILKRTPRTSSQMHYFTIDGDPRFRYRAFFDDFGPPSIAQLIDFARLVKLLLDSTPNKLLHFYTSPKETPLSNSVLYICFFRMYHLRLTPEETIKPLRAIENGFKGYRDASTLPSIFDIRVIDCLQGIHRAFSLGWLHVDTFDSEAWRSMEAIEHGDMNWVIPGKILALGSPYSTCTLPGGFTVCTPADLVGPFKELGVTHVIRLNKRFYDSEDFRSAGFDFTELYFLDGTCPPDGILARFLAIAESPAVIAIHCKAGLGRTYFCFLTHRGTLIGCHMIKNCGFSAREAIAWVRICRPGSVIGPQQLYLVGYEEIIKEQRVTIMEPEIMVREIPVPPRMRKIYFSPMKGFPMEEEIEDDSENRPRTARRSARISRPFTPRKSDRFMNIHAMQIASMHPQPRKLNQRAAPRGQQF